MKESDFRWVVRRLIHGTDRDDRFPIDAGEFRSGILSEYLLSEYLFSTIQARAQKPLMDDT